MRTWQDAGLLPTEVGDIDDAAAGIAAIFGPTLDAEIGAASIGEIIEGQLDMACQCGVQTDENLILITKQLVYIEGYGRELAPHWKLARELFLLRDIFPGEVAAKIAALGIELPDD